MTDHEVTSTCLHRFISQEDILMFSLEHGMYKSIKECLRKVKNQAMSLSPVCQTRLVIATMPRVALNMSGAAQLMHLDLLLVYSQILRGLQFIRESYPSAGASKAYAFCTLNLKKVIIMHMICNEQCASSIKAQLDQTLNFFSPQEKIHTHQNARLVTLLKREANCFRKLVTNLLKNKEARIDYMQDEMWMDFDDKFWANLHCDLLSYLDTIKAFLPTLKIEKLLEQDNSTSSCTILNKFRKKTIAGLEVEDADLLHLLAYLDEDEQSCTCGDNMALNASECGNETGQKHYHCLSKSSFEGSEKNERKQTTTDPISIKHFYGNSPQPKTTLQHTSKENVDIRKTFVKKPTQDLSSQVVNPVKRSLPSSTDAKQKPKKLRLSASEVAALLLSEVVEHLQNDMKHGDSLRPVPLNNKLQTSCAKNNSIFVPVSTASDCLPSASDDDALECNLKTSDENIFHAPSDIRRTSSSCSASPVENSCKNFSKKIHLRSYSNPDASLADKRTDSLSRTTEITDGHCNSPRLLADFTSISNRCDSDGSSSDYVSESEYSGDDASVDLGVDDRYIPDFTQHETWQEASQVTNPAISLPSLASRLQFIDSLNCAVVDGYIIEPDDTDTILKQEVGQVLPLQNSSVI